jgi:hypothetical protein
MATPSETKEQKLDSCVTSVIESFKQRAAVGKAKYGTDLDRKDLSVLEWIQHAQEEHMDAILYLEKLKQLHTPSVKKVVESTSIPSTFAELHWGC